MGSERHKRKIDIEYAPMMVTAVVTKSQDEEGETTASECILSGAAGSHHTMFYVHENGQKAEFHEWPSYQQGLNYEHTNLEEGQLGSHSRSLLFGPQPTENDSENWPLSLRNVAIHKETLRTVGSEHHSLSKWEERESNRTFYLYSTNHYGREANWRGLVRPTVAAQPYGVFDNMYKDRRGSHGFFGALAVEGFAWGSIEAGGLRGYLSRESIIASRFAGALSVGYAGIGAARDVSNYFDDRMRYTEFFSTKTNGSDSRGYFDGLTGGAEIQAKIEDCWSRYN